MRIERQVIRSGYNRKTCWTHARPGIIPGDPPVAVVTMHALRLTGVDVFYPVHDLRSNDGGTTWREPIGHEATLGRHQVDNGIEEGISDLTPAWHNDSGTLLATGHTIRYLHDNLQDHPRPRSTVYTVYDPATAAWQPWRKLVLPDDRRFFCEGAGSTQRVDLPNGDVLLPTYLVDSHHARSAFDFDATSTVLRCTFDGHELTYVEHGSVLGVPTGGGLVEPSLAHAADRYWLTLRNEEAGYVATSRDGLHYDSPIRWTFDDGSDLGNYNTQQHWMTNGDALYLIYTRRGANNDHVFRHRAPLFIAQVDTDRACVIRDTEQVLVPDRGARLGNFGVARVNDHEVWVVVSEWMQTTAPDHHDYRVCERYGSDNSIFLAKVKF